MLLYPPCRWLEQKGWPKSLSVAALLTIVVILFLGVIGLLGMELNIFMKDLPKVSGRLARIGDSLQQWIEQKYKLPRDTQAGWIDKTVADTSNNLRSLLGTILNTTISTTITLVMIPVYAALFLYHRSVFVRFAEKITGNLPGPKIRLILQQSILAYFRYVRANFYVYCIVGVLNSIGLILLGIENPILYGMLTSFMMVIPYIGIFISASIPVSIALITKDSGFYAIAVVAIFAFIQYLESNVLFPRIVGQQMNLSTWSTLVAMVAATILWGIAGMVLITPFLGILKIVADQMPSLEPVSILLSRSHR